MGQGTRAPQHDKSNRPISWSDGAFTIRGQVLHVLAKSPFAELLAAWPPEADGQIQALAQNGRWGQMVECQHSAVMPKTVLEPLRAALARRYSQATNPPVTAVVCAPGVEGGLSGAPKLLACFSDAGVESRLFKDCSTALDWIDSRIRPLTLHVEWRPEYRLGEAGMDEQHRELFGRASYVVGAASHQGQVMAAMRLFQYMRSHVSYEDELMRRYDYPHIEEHRARHHDLMRRLSDISQSIANEDMVLVDLEKFVESLFLAHMNSDDRKLADYLQAQRQLAGADGKPA